LILLLKYLNTENLTCSSAGFNVRLIGSEVTLDGEVDAEFSSFCRSSNLVFFSDSGSWGKGFVGHIPSVESPAIMNKARIVR